MIEITYDRTERIYKWMDPNSGEVLTAPARRKQDLFRAALGILDPDLAEAAEHVVAKYPQLERVTWKATELVARNALDVFPVPHGGVLAMVDSSDEFGRYAVEQTAHGLTCQCVHFQDGHAPLTQSGTRYCKHIMAVTLWQQVRAEW